VKGLKTQKKNQILIIDDQPLFREGFNSIVGRYSEFMVIGETGSGKEGFQMVKTFKPDLVVMEISLPDYDAVQLIRDIRHYCPKICVVVLSAYHEIECISKALKSGARGYVGKEIDPDKLIDVFNTVLNGISYLDSTASPDHLTILAESDSENDKALEIQNGFLTPREQEVMRMMAEGVPRRQIASKLCISPKTVENHAWRIMKKLSISNILELVRYAAKIGLIDLDLWKEGSVHDPLMAQSA